MSLHPRHILKAAYRRLMRKLAVRRNVEFHPDLQVGQGCFINAPDRLTIGREVAIGSSTWISCNGRIGSGVLIASQVGIVSRHEHDMLDFNVPISKASKLGDPGSRARDARDEIDIGDDVWIGFNVTILTGLRIGRGAVVAAGAVVTRDVEPYAVVAGNPARKVTDRMPAANREAHERALTARWR
jgi:acetyltransferase-like isoleucine patch superfamily enzyme